MWDVSQRTASLFLIFAHLCSVEHSSIVALRVNGELLQLQISEAKQEVSDMKWCSSTGDGAKSLSSSLKCSLLKLMVNFEIQGWNINDRHWPRIGVYYTYSAFFIACNSFMGLQLKTNVTCDEMRLWELLVLEWLSMVTRKLLIPSCDLQHSCTRTDCIRN